jgi:hypothetical protein
VLRNTFAVRTSRGRGLGAVVGSFRLALRDPNSAAAVAALDAQVPKLLRRHGVVGVHWLEAAPQVRAQMDAVRAVGQSDAGVEYVLLIEAPRVAEIEAIRSDALATASLARLGFAEQGYGIYSLMYEVSPLGPGDEKLEREAS